jgi:hypothetical protein
MPKLRRDITFIIYALRNQNGQILPTGESKKKKDDLLHSNETYLEGKLAG